MSAHSINARKASDDADYWENMARDAEANATRYRRYALCRRKDAEDYKSMEEREQKIG